MKQISWYHLIGAKGVKAGALCNLGLERPEDAGPMEVTQLRRAAALPPVSRLRPACSASRTSFQAIDSSPPSSKSCTVFLPSTEAKRFWICAVTFFSSDALRFCLAFSILGSWHQKIQKIRHSTSCITTARILHASSTYRKLKYPLLFETLLAKGMLLMKERNMLAQGILVTAKRRCLYPGHCCCEAERLPLPIPRYRAVSMQKY